MKFGDLPPKDAEGAVLAHSLRLGKGILKKGRLLTRADIAALADAGYESIPVARLEPGDLDENAAAIRLAEAVGGTNVTRSQAATGRVNLFAAIRGLTVLDTDSITRFNGLDEAVTMATVAPYALVEAGQNVATIKIIPFAVSDSVVTEATRIAKIGGPLIDVAALRPRKVGLIQTTLPHSKDSVLEKGRQATDRRLEVLGCAPAREKRVAHEESEIAAALRQLVEEKNEIVLILGAAATTDRRDVVPAAISRAGGSIEHFGLPVDPGNLTLLATCGEARVLGLPGSARSPRPHGFDWLLRRLVAGLAVGDKEIAAMGIGGLLKDVPGRPLPREKAAPSPPVPGLRPKVAAIVLAAGQSRRMGSVNKLLAEVNDRPMVAWVVEAALASAADPVFVVTGHEADRVAAALSGYALRFVHNPDYEQGLSTSLNAGISALPESSDGALVCLGDMPQVRAEDLDRLIGAFDPARGHAICVPVYDGKRGNPVLWARRFFNDMRTIMGDVGARHLIGENADMVVEVDMAGEGVLVDVDSQDALAAL